MESIFPATYQDSRQRFIQDFEVLRGGWSSSSIDAYPLTTDPSLSIDYAWAVPKKKQNLVVISTGLHGIEGYVGSAMLKIFMDDYAPLFNAENTGLLLVHTINPFGMNVRRRYNENNVDLNRNFLPDEKYDRTINLDYEPLIPMLNPTGSLENLFLDEVKFISRLVTNIAQMGILRIRQGMLSGQYRHGKGVQFGGNSLQESALLMRGLLMEALGNYELVVHIDLHSGYGPRYQMSIVNAVSEKATSAEMVKRFHYPLILAATPGEFYTTTGDITEYFYILREESFPQKKLFATCFEFGTYGESLFSQIRSMRATIFENRLFQFGAKNDGIRRSVRKDYEELFFPTEPGWREKATADCRQAYDGVFSDFGLLGKR